MSTPSPGSRSVAHDSGPPVAPDPAGGGAVEPSARALPLNPDERAQVDRAGRRLHSGMVAFLAGLPDEARNASGMARHLGIDRTTCQRSVFVASRPYAGLDIFERLPGVRALRVLARAAQSVQPAVDPALIDALNAAVNYYEQVIQALAGSSTRLCRRIALDSDTVPTPPGSNQTADARRRLFDAAQEVTGRASDCWVAVYVYRPSPDDPNTVEVVRAHGLRGHSARGDAIPLVTQNFSTRDDAEPPQPGEHFTNLEQVDGDNPESTVLMSDFTSSPSPLVTARQPGTFLVQAIDTPPGSAGEPVDIMLATRTTMPHPARQSPPIEEVWGLVNFPCRHLLLDVYLHPDLARRSVPSLDAHLWGPGFEENIGNRWQTRTNETTPLQLLGSGVRANAPDAFPQLPGLTQQLFDRSKIDPSPYVGFRCDVAYPLWRVGYCITFDFTE